LKVADTNYGSCGHKPSQHVKMFATKSVTSSASCGLVVDTNHESRRRDLCCELSCFVSATSPRLCRELVANFVAKSA